MRVTNLSSRDFLSDPTHIGSEGATYSGALGPVRFTSQCSEHPPLPTMDAVRSYSRDIANGHDDMPSSKRKPLAHALLDYSCLPPTLV